MPGATGFGTEFLGSVRAWCSISSSFQCDGQQVITVIYAPAGEGEAVTCLQGWFLEYRQHPVTAKREV